MRSCSGHAPSHPRRHKTNCSGLETIILPVNRRLAPQIMNAATRRHTVRHRVWKTKERCAARKRCPGYVVKGGKRSKFGNNGRVSSFLLTKTPKEYLSINMLLGTAHVVKAHRKAGSREQVTPPLPLHIPDPLTLFCMCFFPQHLTSSNSLYVYLVIMFICFFYFH